MGAGTYADYVVCKEEWLAFAPASLKLDTAAGAVPLVALTAFQVGHAVCTALLCVLGEQPKGPCQVDNPTPCEAAACTQGERARLCMRVQALSSANLKPGDRVLVHAGAGGGSAKCACRIMHGAAAEPSAAAFRALDPLSLRPAPGVGTWAVQLAKVHWQCHVVATAGPRNQEFLKSIGADEALDYTSQRFDEVYADAPFDCVVDLIGGARRAQSGGTAARASS